MKISNSYHWLVGLLALPMLMISQPSLAYDTMLDRPIGIYNEKTSGLVAESCSTCYLWSVSTEGTVSNIHNNNSYLDFYLERSANGNGSLSLFSGQSFYGTLHTIQVFCDYADGLVIKAYDGQKELGEFTYNGKIYELLNLSYVMRNTAITIKFMIATPQKISQDGSNGMDQSVPSFDNNGNQYLQLTGVSVSNLSSIAFYVEERTYPLPTNQPVTFNPADFLDKDLSNFTYDGILFTLNTLSDGDGFENEDGVGAIYMGTVMTDDYVATVSKDVDNGMLSPGDYEYSQAFAGGITIKVPAGSGYLRVDAQTEGNYVLHVRIGNKRVVEICNTKRRISEIPYKVDKETYVYVYLTQTASGSRGTRIGKRGAAHGKLYSFCSSTAPETTSLSLVIPEGGKLAMVSPYDLDFSSLEAKGVKAYICTGYELASKTFWLTRVNDVPANTPILVKGVKGASTTYTVPVTTSRIYYPENFLVGSAMEDFNVDKSEGFLNYVVTKSQGTIASMPGGTSVLAAGKAYFHVPVDVTSTVASGGQEFTMGKGKKLLAVSDYNLDFTKVNGLKAYVVTAFDLDRTIWLSRVMKASAGTPLLLRGEQSEGVYNVPSVATKMAYVNMLVGNTSSADVTISPEMDGCVIYVLQLSKGTFATIGKDASMAKGKAWLPVPKSFYSRIPASRGAIDVIDQESEVICIKAGLDGEDDGTTSIRRVDSSQFAVDSDVWYNLKGQRVAIPTKKGLYIKNGKKVYVR